MKILMLLIRNVHFSALNADCSLVTKLCPTLCNPMDCNRPGFPALHHLLEFAQTHVHCFSDASNHLVLCHPFLLLPSIFPSLEVFSSESDICIMWPKYWSLSSSISPFNDYSWLVSFRVDCFDLLALQGTLNANLQHHNPKASIFLCSAFFMDRLSHPFLNHIPSFGHLIRRADSLEKTLMLGGIGGRRKRG